MQARVDKKEFLLAEGIFFWNPNARDLKIKVYRKIIFSGAIKKKGGGDLW